MSELERFVNIYYQKIGQEFIDYTQVYNEISEWKIYFSR